MYKARRKKRKDKKLSKAKMKQACVFKRSAAKSKGHCLSNDSLDNCEISLYEEADNPWKHGKKLGLMLRMMRTLLSLCYEMLKQVWKSL